MSSRKLGYVIVVGLLAIVFSAPQLLVGISICADAYQRGNISSFYSNQHIPGLSGTMQYWSALSYAPFWRGQFISVAVEWSGWSGPIEFKINGTDAETGATTLQARLSDRNWVQPVVFGDRLWLVSPSATYEVVDGVCVPGPMMRRTGGAMSPLLWKGEPAYLEQSGREFVVTTYTAGGPKAVAAIIFPDSSRIRTVGSTQVNFASVSAVDCRQQGDRVHAFVCVNWNLLYHDGLEFTSKPPPSPYQATSAVANTTPTDEPVSALKAANTDDDLAGWSVISSGANLVLPQAFQSGEIDRQAVGLIVDGQPAALIVEDVLTGSTVGRLYRFDGTSWAITASREFPFGSYNFRSVTTSDGQRSYVVATTSTGAAHVYAVEASGIRETKGAENEPIPALQQLSFYVIFPSLLLVFGVVLGLCVWFVMWLCTKPDYGFGKQSIKLSSLGWRGLARLIDLALMIFSTIGLGWAMTIGFDWIALLDALNMHVDHPTRPIAARVAWILGVWLIVLVAMLICVQGVTGATPGKWLCRLRTVRTSLRPCGLVASLTREVAFLFDCFGFLCWTPGILCIAFTDCRQRFGDLVADTIVVDARTLVTGE